MNDGGTCGSSAGSDMIPFLNSVSACLLFQGCEVFLGTVDPSSSLAQHHGKQPNRITRFDGLERLRTDALGF